MSDLADLRAELDRTDDALLAALVRRAALSARIGALAVKGPVKIRPGREATILRRLLAQDRGHLRAQTVIRVWRELLAGSTALQGPFSIGVGADDPALIALAREQFGALTPLTAWPTPADAIDALRAGAATVAVLPMPEERARAWWPALLDPAAVRLHVVGRLPFWRPVSLAGLPGAALVVAASPPDPSGDDRTLLALTLPPHTARPRLHAALAVAGLPAGRTILQGEHALVELDGFVEAIDNGLAARLATLAGPLPGPAGPAILGAFAIPSSAS